MNAWDSFTSINFRVKKYFIETCLASPAIIGLAEVSKGFSRAIAVAHANGVASEQIVLDIGLGFGKTFDQNLELIAKLDKLVSEFDSYPMLVGASRKSFIGKILGGAAASERLGGSIAAAVAAVTRGARIVRVHDVKETVAALKVASVIDLTESE